MTQPFLKFLLVLPVSVASAALEKSPTEMYSVAKLVTHQTTITVLVVDDVRKGCEAESHRRNLGGFKHAFDACSFWNEETCTIVVGKRTNNDILGHEFRHCIQGNFH